MFCFQCQETLKNEGCTKQGVCGKTNDTANEQDRLIATLKGVAYWAEKGRAHNVVTEEDDAFLIHALFVTVTNVNFSVESCAAWVKRAKDVRNALRERVLAAYKEKGTPFTETPPPVAEGVNDTESEGVGVQATKDENIRSLRELITYGLKGIGAYAHHAYVLGKKSDDVAAFITHALAALTDETKTLDDYIALTLATGKAAADVLALLDGANKERFGAQEITEVATGMQSGKGILVSGHDLLDLEELLKQTEGKGVNIYTHGEMLPANAYPALKRFPHLVGNYGGSWWKQREEFDAFPGAILMTTNCIQKPKDSYKDRIFTTGVVAFNGLTHIEDRRAGGEKDFSPVIEKALSLPDLPNEKGAPLTIGFAHDAVMGVADKVVEAVKAGAIKRFVVMAGCDGRHKEREYFTKVAEALPNDAVILTAGCAKYRYNALDLGDIGGIPRVLDAGQCNDSYSLAVIALKLQEVFGAEDVNDLPIAFDIGWYEQKAVTVLLALLHLGFKHIRLGPTLPAFLSPGVAKTLVETFGLMPTKGVDEDVAAIMSAK